MIIKLLCYKPSCNILVDLREKKKGGKRKIRKFSDILDSGIVPCTGACKLQRSLRANPSIFIVVETGCRELHCKHFHIHRLPPSAAEGTVMESKICLVHGSLADRSDVHDSLSSRNSRGNFTKENSSLSQNQCGFPILRLNLRHHFRLNPCK